MPDKIPDREIRASEVMSQATLTVHVTGVRSMRVRLWVGMQLIKLASWIGGFKAHFIEDE